MPETPISLLSDFIIRTEAIISQHQQEMAEFWRLPDEDEKWREAIYLRFDEMRLLEAAQDRLHGLERQQRRQSW